MTVVSARQAYGLLASEYDAHPNPLVSLERRVMVPLLPALNRRRVIDAGSGTGRWARYCASQGAKVIALDFSREMLERGPHPAVEGDLRELPFRDASADVTICSFALGYASGCLSELARITRPGGIVLVSDMHPDAIQRGWNRSFRHSSGVINIEHQPYQLEDLHVAGLELSCLLEPKFGLAEHQIFIDAGHGARFEEASREAAIFVARWTRR
jgi:malonyl-CoA O-methyltransferase